MIFRQPAKRVLWRWASGLALALLAAAAWADGTYEVLRDADGLYFQTDGDGSWSIPEADRPHFRAGEHGVYTMGRDQGGRFISIDRGGKYYIAPSPSPAANPAAEEFKRRQEAQRPATPVTIRHDMVFVPVRLGHGRAVTEAVLLLDTGASITVLHREVAERIGLRADRRDRFMVAGGQTITSEVARLGSLRVGPQGKSDLTVAIIDHAGPAVPYQGLLGMIFLKGLNYRIDFQRQVIHWQR
jgi:predicted aspartyl protease